MLDGIVQVIVNPVAFFRKLLEDDKLISGLLEWFYWLRYWLGFMVIL